MAVAVDQIASTNIDLDTGSLSNTVSGNITVGSGANTALVLGISIGANSLAGLTVTWDPAGTAQAMTLISGTDAVNGTNETVFYGLLAPTPGAMDINFTVTSGNTDCNACLISFTGVDQTGGTTSFPNGNTATGTTATPSITGTSASGNYCLATYSNPDQLVVSVDNDFIYIDNGNFGPVASGMNGSAGSSSVTLGAVLGGTTAGWAASFVDVQAAGGTPPPPVTWNPSDTGGGTLYNNDLSIAGVTSGSATTRATSSYSTGKFYFESWVNYNNTNSYGGWAVGVANGSMTLTEYLGQTSSTSFGYFANNGGFLPSGSGGASPIGTLVGIAIDFGAQLLWARPNGGEWNGSGTANPATGTGGVSFSAITGPYFPAFTTTSINGNPSGFITSNFGASTFLHSPPSGFSPFTDPAETDLSAAKIAQFAVLSPPELSVAKVTQFAVLSPPELSVAKVVQYAVLGPHVDPTIHITGVQANAQVGTLTAPSPGTGILGVGATAGIGTMATEASAFGLVGVQATAGISALLVTSGPNTGAGSITGVAASAQIGSLVPKVQKGLTGVGASAQVGIVRVLIFKTGFHMTDLEVVTIPSMETDASVSMRVSFDKGATFGNARLESMGATGEYYTNMQWLRLGYGRSILVELAWSSPRPTAIANLFCITDIEET